MVRIKWAELPLEYPGYCMICGKHMKRGTNAQQFRGVGIRHISCGKTEDQFEELKQKSFEAVAREDPEAAAEFARDALDIQPNGDEIFNLAGSVYDRWDFETAIKLYDRVLEKNPKHVGALMNKASSLRHIGKHDEAIRCYNKIIKMLPDKMSEYSKEFDEWTDALAQKADTYIYGKRDCKKAIPILKKMTRLFPSAYNPSAIRFAQCGEYERALKINEKILSADPDSIDARNNKLLWLTSLMVEQRSEKDAMAIINKYLKDEPKFFVAQLKNNFYSRAKRRDAAVKAFRTMLNEEPKTDFDRMIKANALLAMGNHKVTRKFCDENMHRDAISYHLQVTIGRTYEMENNLVKALEVYTRLRLRNEEVGHVDTFLLRRIADIDDKLGDDDAALSARASILDQDIYDKEVLVKAIRMLKRFKHSTTRIAYLKRLHGLYPGNNNFTIEYADALFVNNEYGKAKELYEQVAQGYDVGASNNDDAMIAMLKIAECTLKMDDAKTAYKMFTVLVKQDKKFKEAWTGLAKAATELGKIPEAQKAIKMAANLEKYEISRDVVGSEHVDNVLFTQASSLRQQPERSLSKGPDVVQKPTFKYNPKTGMADRGVEKTFVDNVDSLLNGHGGTMQIGFTDGKPTGLFNDLKLFPKNKRNNEEFEKKLRETLQRRLSGSSTLRDIRITFPKTHHVTVCEMFIAKSPVPVYVVTKNRDEEFYVRRKKDLVRLGPKEQTEYITEHFFDID